MVKAQVTAYENCVPYDNGDVHYGAMNIAAGRDFDPTAPSFESRLIGQFNETNNVLFVKCARSVYPDQQIALDYRISFEVNAVPVGSVTVDGMSHSIFPITGHPDFGFIFGYRNYILPGENEVNWHTVKYSDYSSPGWKPINHTGTPFTPNLTVTITSDSHQISTWNKNFRGLYQYRTQLVWLGTSAPNPNASFDINGLDLGFKAHLQTQRKNADGTSTWTNQPITAQAKVFRIHLYLLSINATCATPSADQLVKLPMVWANEFTGVTDTRGETNFDLTFSGCARYMHAIRYKFYSTHPADNFDTNNAALGLVSLNNQPGSASGIKVQILDRDTDTPITLDQFRVAPQYTGTQTGFTIPFKARYYQTENQVAAGKVRATAFFQIIYQ